MTYRAYAGIGSRKATADICNTMSHIAGTLAREGWTLRSGHAAGADLAFEEGAITQNGDMEIMLPWNGFNGAWTANQGYYEPVNQMSLELAAQFHPAWHLCSPAAKKLHARNVHQILGLDLQTPVECVICWTPNASRSGGTGQALRIAEHYNIPIFDLAEEGAIERLESFIPQPA